MSRSPSTPLEDTPSHLKAGVAELSRPHRYSKHVLRHPETSSLGHTYSDNTQKAQRTNWMNPFLWTMIDSAAKAVGYPWRPVDIVQRLKLQQPELFAKLSPQRISDWRDTSIKDQLVWKDNVIAATQHGNHPRGENLRHSILVSEPIAIQVHVC